MDPAVSSESPNVAAFEPYTLEQDLPARMVVIGDLNGQYNLLERYLTDLKLLRRNGTWAGGRTVLVQIGDIVNRGPGARASMDLVMRLRPQAREAGGEIVWLLGNHEVMSTLGHEAYVSADEYLEFASNDEVDHFFYERTRYIYELLGAPDVPSYVEPVGGKVKAWEEHNAPGKKAYRFAMGPDGIYGRYIRQLPIALRYGKLLLVHGGLSPQWAQLGLSGLAAASEEAWASRPKFYQELDPSGIFRDPLGPLWHRAYCVSNAHVVKEDAHEALNMVGCTQMLVGHTRTDSVEGGHPSVPLARQGGRVIMTDVGLGEPGEAGCALVVEKGRIEYWSPGGSRSRLVNLRKR